MIKNLTLSLLLVGTGVFAQTAPERKCGTMEHMEYLKQQNPLLEKQLLNYNEVLNDWMARNPSGSAANRAGAVRTIPLVFHIVYNTAAQNISDEQIMSQLKAVNEDFSRTNADASQTPAAFKSVAGNPNVQFCLAQRDPSGKATTGIVRVKTTKTGFATDNGVKKKSTGGDDAWDVTKYYNIWICNFSDKSLLGYGEFPGPTASDTWGYVGTYLFTGTTPNVNPPFNKGRTTTHEMGHTFNLKHIWGDDGTACTGSDDCTDTPNQAGPSGQKPNFPLTDACTPKSPGVMYMNYMDYSDDDVMNMFTVQQVKRMDAILSNAPYKVLLSSNGCEPVGAPTVASVAITSSDSDNTICDGTSVKFTAAPTNGGTTPTYQWKIGNTVVGTAATYTATNLKDAEVVTCVMTSNLTGATGSPATSNSIEMKVNPIPSKPVISAIGTTLTSSSDAGNTWYYNGVAIAGANGQSVTATKNGNYTVMVTINECSNTSSILIVTLGIKSLSGDNSLLSAYPNPTDGIVTVSFESANKSAHVVEIKNALGQVVYKEVVTNFNGVYSKSVNLQEYGKGIYTISLTDNTNVVSRKLIVY